MKREFFGFYSPTQEDFKRLWSSATIIFDTNVLLDLYRLPKNAREELFAVFETLKDRLWIPYQVALEYQNKRLSVIATERKSIEDAISQSRSLFDRSKALIEALQIDKRGLDIDVDPILDNLRIANENLVDVVAKVHQEQLDIAAHDPIRDTLNILFEDRVGSPPVDQVALETFTSDGEVRYASKIPPGYKDASKDKDPNEARMYHDGLVYERKYGDLILWRQILEFSKMSNLKDVIFVTSDQKEDWWWIERGKTMGPRPELAREICKLANVECFWMYTSSRFLESAKEYLQADVTDASVSELDQVARNRPDIVNHLSLFDDGAPRDIRRISPPSTPIEDGLKFYMASERGLRDWLRMRYGLVEERKQFPDFVVSDNGENHGFECKTIRAFSKRTFTTQIADVLVRGLIDIVEKKIDRFTLVFITTSEEIDRLLHGTFWSYFNERLSEQMRRYKKTEVIVGFLDEYGVFVPSILLDGHGNWNDFSN